MTNRYQMYTYVVFSDPKSIAKIPKKGYTFKISAPVMEDRPGGPGLDDIKHLLESADEVKDFEFELSPVPRGRVIGARILSTRMLLIVLLPFSFTNVKNHSPRLLHSS